MGSRLTLLKSIFCSLPIYSLSVRVFPMRVQNNLHSLMSIFLWGGTEEKRKIHLVDLQNVIRPCVSGGLRVTDLSNMNVALLAKWVYRYVNDGNHLWRRVVCTKSGTNPSRMLSNINHSS